MRFLYFTLFILEFSLVTHAQLNIQDALRQLQTDPALKGSQWSVCAFDMETGDTIAQWNPDLALPGASITKLFSTAAALATLGPDYKATTKIYMDGPLKNGILNGNVWIVGGGDVSLGSRYFHEPGTEFQFLDQWVLELKKIGIQYITGSIIADAEAFGYESCPIGWERADMGNYYGCGAYGLNFFDNTLKLTFKTGAPGTLLQLQSVYPNDLSYKLTIEAKAASINNDQSFVHGIPFDVDRKITGSLPAHRNQFVVKASMPDPEKLMAQLFYESLQKNGIRVDGGPRSKRLSKQILDPKFATFLFENKGKTVKDVVFWTNQRSVNLYAEGLLRQVGYHRYGFGSYENGLKVLDSLNRSWAVGPVQIVDGSGLSKANNISARQFVNLLHVQINTDYFPSFYGSLPIAGLSGTVKSLCAGQIGAGRIHAKSGSIDGIKAYAGYVESLEGHMICFAIIANHSTLSGTQLSKKMEPLLNALVSSVQPE
ncbi:MAG: hypothetical protein RLZZ38_1149 [Bacteroidota bacterium]|jgi:D-alanyl-D-alanine carboxypeptidase/D-alanyl-D-alanine-endopeptidase (penicillin-binding protein 4)